MTQGLGRYDPEPGRNERLEDMMLSLSQAPEILASFGGTNGGWLQSSLYADAAGDLFGTTEQGGATGFGIAFELVKTATGYSAPVTLATFTGTNGEYSHAGLIADAAGDLFGTTSGDGSSTHGTVFELVKTATGYGAPVILTAFNGTNGNVPMAALTIDAAGDLFGTTLSGGANGAGNVFELAKTATGYAAATTLATFAGANGASPEGKLITDAAGNLFGTTEYGGADNDGNVFELAKTATGYAAPVTLASFTAATGRLLTAGLTMDAAGNLFGVTRYGGAKNDGTVFEMAKTATGYAAPVTLTGFTGSNGDQPLSALIIDAAGNLYGTTRYGGASNDGTVFELVKTATGYSAPVTLASLNASTGLWPEASLTRDAAGDLFGTAVWGGANKDGTVFEVTAAQVATALAAAEATQTYTLTTKATSISGDIGNDVINAAAKTLLKPDVLIGGTGTNTLNLIGGGAFNLAAPATLSNIAIVNLAEGQVSTASVQTVSLRAGLNAQIYITSGTPEAGSTDPETITVNGAAGDASTIHLGAGNDIVTLGSAAESVVNTPTGATTAQALSAEITAASALVKATATTAGALISTSGATTLELTDGGTVQLNAADTGVAAINLDNTTTAWSFISTLEAGQSITDKSASADTLNVWGANDTITLGKNDTLALHAGMGNDTVFGFATSGAKQDMLQLDSNVFADWAHLLGATTQQGSDLLITIDASDSIVLKNVSLASFTQADVKFA